MSTLTVGTIAEKVTDAGVAVDGVTLKDGGATFTSAVGVTGNTTITSGNLVIGTSGNGIDFSATSDASGQSSELLDDYEEGTWTPSVSGGSISGTSITYSGTYTKVGRSVFITFRAENSAGDINVSSFVTFSGVPFTIDKESSSTVITEDIEQDSRHGFVSIGGTTLALSNCGSSSGSTSLRIGITGHTA